MAIPRIEAADTAKYTRASGEVFGKAVEKIGSIAGQVILKKDEIAKANEPKKKMIDQTMDTLEEHYRKSYSLYGEPIEEQLVPDENLDLDGLTVGTASPQLIRARGGRTVPMKKVNSAAFQALRKKLDRSRAKLETLSTEQIRDYQFGMGSWVNKTTEFAKKYGRNALPFIEPTVEQAIRDPFAKNVDAQIKEFDKKSQAKMALDIAGTWLKDPKNKDRTYEDFKKDQISKYGVPDTSIDENGERLPENLEQGRFDGKIIESFALAEYDNMIKGAFTTEAEKHKRNMDAQGKALEERRVKVQEQRENRLKNSDGSPSASLQERIKQSAIRNQNNLSRKIKTERSTLKEKLDKVLKENKYSLSKEEIENAKNGIPVDFPEINRIQEKLEIAEEKKQLFEEILGMVDRGEIERPDFTEDYIDLVHKAVYDGPPGDMTPIQAMLREKFNPAKEAEPEGEIGFLESSRGLKADEDPRQSLLHRSNTPIVDKPNAPMQGPRQANNAPISKGQTSTDLDKPRGSNNTSENTVKLDGLSVEEQNKLWLEAQPGTKFTKNGITKVKP